MSDSAAKVAVMDPKPATTWWSLQVPEAKSLIALGQGEALKHAQAICEAIKLPFQVATPDKFEELLKADASAAVLAEFHGLMDPVFALATKLRRQPIGMSRRWIASVASAQDVQLLNQVLVLPPTGLWLAPYPPKLLASFLVRPINGA